MHGIIEKQGFVVIVACCYNICLLNNFVIMILQIVVCEDCVRENKLPLLGPSWAIFAIFFLEKNSDFNAIWLTF